MTCANCGSFRTANLVQRLAVSPCGALTAHVVGSRGDCHGVAVLRTADALSDTPGGIEPRPCALLLGHSNTVTALAFSPTTAPSGALLLCSASRDRARVWRVQDNNAKASLCRRVSGSLGGIDSSGEDEGVGTDAVQTWVQDLPPVAVKGVGRAVE